MITTDAALYGAARAALLDRATLPTADGGGPAAQVAAALTTCGCGQELVGVSRRHCPRCGCCLG